MTDSGDAPATAGTPSQTLSRPGQQIQISWQADDPDGDRLIYSLYFRGEDEREWKLLRANMTENTYLLDGDVFADGRYYFSVTASDAPSNPANLAREAELVSAPVLIDNTPPVVTASAPRRTATGRNRCRRGGSRLRAAALRILDRRGAMVAGRSGGRRDRFGARAFSDPAGQGFLRASTWW